MGDWRTLVQGRLEGLDLDAATADEVVEELAQHLEDRYRALLASGVADPDARTRSLAELEGHPRLQRDLSRLKRPLAPPRIQGSSLGGWRAVLQDARFAWRRLRHAPGFAAMAILTLAIAVGANTAILSFADAVLFRPLPYADPNRVFVLQMADEQDRLTGDRSTMTPFAFIRAINDCCESVSEVGLVRVGPGVFVDTPDGRSRIPTAAVTANYFPILGVVPARGRVLGEGDAGLEGRAAMLSHAFWQQQFAGDEAIVGSTVTVGRASFEVVGVLPSAFVFPSVFAGRPDIVVLTAPPTRDQTGGALHSLVRVAPGSTRERAQAEVDAATAPVAQAIQRESTPVLDDVRSVLYLVAGPIMRLLLAAAGLVLLIGCANLANMMLVRGRRTARESAVRLALGATRMRLIRPMVFESMMVGLIGAVLAIVTTAALFEVLAAQVPRVGIGSAPIGMTTRVVVASLVAGLVAMMVFSVIPAWRAAGIDVLALIQNRGTRGRTAWPLGHPLVTAQIALAVTVTFGAVIAARAFVDVLQTPLGFSPDNVIRVSVGSADRQVHLDAVERLRQRGDVIAVGAGGSIPFSNRAADHGVWIAGKEAPASAVQVLPGYFEAIGAPLIRGRFLAWEDVRNNPDIAVLSDSAANAAFPGADAIDQLFDDGEGRTFRVVGIVGDVTHSLGGRADSPRAYVMPGPTGRSFLDTLVVRMRDRREASLAEIRAEVRRVMPTAGIGAVWWSDQIGRDTAYRNPRFQTLVLGTFALLALGVTALGIFAVVGHQVVSRTREMGVRLAIGATPGSLKRLVVGQAILPVILGLAAGGLLIHWGRGLAEAQLYEVNTEDPWTLAASGVTVVVASLVAAYLPARRATRIDPVAVLRAE
jgi:predicted permease